MTEPLFAERAPDRKASAERSDLAASRAADASNAPYAWWASLNHVGLLIAPSKLAERFPASLPPPGPAESERLRRDLTRLLGGGEERLSAFLDTVLEDLLGLGKVRFKKGNEVDKLWSQPALTGEIIHPHRVWLGPNGGVFPIFVDTSAPRLGVGHGKRPVARVVAWIRTSAQSPAFKSVGLAPPRLALLANARQIRLIHAGADHDAFCEWDTALWFAGGAPGPQVQALRALLSAEALTPPAEGKPSRLLDAIQASRQGQAELSSALSERVRLAVERLIRESAPALERIDAGESIARRHIYVAATRLVMRCVVILFAEARELLPRSNAIYEGSYGLQGLRADLDRMVGGRAAERLRHSYGAFPRLLSLFKLVYEGSAHEALPVPRYAGGLFTPGDSASPDPVLRALAAFESPENTPTDHAVQGILELLCKSRVRVRQGRTSRWVEAPVDFSDLSSEYLGILYEGLLDFELRRAPADDAIVFLNLGAQPALPLARLDRMTNEELAQLLDKLKTSGEKVEKGEGEGADEDAEAEASEPDTDLEPEPSAADALDALDASDSARTLHKLCQSWAERAVKAAKLVKYPRKDTDHRVREQWNCDVEKTARALVQRLILPGGWFLVRWGGTRKGSGTFYTRPQLASPIVRRALQPLAYAPVREENDAQTGLVTVTAWAPRAPEAILELKVCDPAMGSGSFLISALRTLTQALIESLHHHKRLEARGDQTVLRLADGLPADHPSHELLPVGPDHPDFDERLRARLKRYVVERCIYGVDLDPLAVELARTALWVETMDRELPFGFLDHKLKCGNALVGCWFDRFQDYPIMAWEREGGDKGHTQFVHHFREVTDKKGRPALGLDGKPKKAGDKWTAAIKERRERMRVELRRWLEQRFSEQAVLESDAGGKSAGAIHDEALALFEKIHALPVQAAEERERVYREEFLGSPAIQRLREALDTWCALWFWPGDALEKAPGPMTLLEPGADALEVVGRVRDKERFFHWELEFPDVFVRSGSGFDAVVGNPPWEIEKPNSMEFFSSLDPLYRTYGKQEALKQQATYFREIESAEQDWLAYSARFKALSNWTKSAAEPFGAQSGKEGDVLIEKWSAERASRRGYADAEHPFQHQGSADVNTYKMFLEVAHAGLARSGILGLLVPSGIYTDNGSGELRRLFLDRCDWMYLYAFQNERFVFLNIDHRFKMAVVHVRKRGKTASLRTRFRIGPGDSPEEHEVEEDLLGESAYLALPAKQIQRFSPTGAAILELRGARDLRILEKLYEKGVLLGDDDPRGWGILYAREFDMTNDSKLFPPRPQWEAQGYRSDAYGHWLKGSWRARDDEHPTVGRSEEETVRSADGAMVIGLGTIEDVALPLEQGGMLHQFDYSQKGWVRGTGLRAIWRPIPWEDKRIEPQFLLSIADFDRPNAKSCKPSVRRIARNTDARMMIAGYVPRMPCGDVASVLQPRQRALGPALIACLNSFVCDEMVRGRCGGTHVDYHYIAEIPLPRPEPKDVQMLTPMALSLSAAHIAFATEWLALIPEAARTVPWRRLWAVTPHERLRLRSILDAIVAELYGLDLDDFAWILRDCDHPTREVCDKPFSRTLDPKGFWRVDKDQDPELRHPVLAQVAFRDLKRLGTGAFLAQNGGDGWSLPETLRLADYGLGHDARAQEPQPVAARLGERFLSWQLEQGVEASWEECRRHAETIEKILGIAKR